MASLGNRHDGKKSKKQKHVNKKNEIFPHGNYRQYYGNVDEELSLWNKIYTALTQAFEGPHLKNSIKP